MAFTCVGVGEADGAAEADGDGDGACDGCDRERDGEALADGDMTGPGQASQRPGGAPGGPRRELAARAALRRGAGAGARLAARRNS